MRSTVSLLSLVVLVCCSYTQADVPSAEVKAIIGQLKNPDESVRLAAAKKLAKLGPLAKEAIPALKAALKDKDLDVQAMAKKALDAIGDAGDTAKGKLDGTAKKELIEGVKAKSAAERDKALTAIAALGEDGQELTAPLLEAMVRHPKEQEKFLTTLDKINPSLHPHVVTIMVDNDASRVRLAIFKLGNMGSKAESTIPFLTTVFAATTPPRVNNVGDVLNALPKINPKNETVARYAFSVATSSIKSVVNGSEPVQVTAIRAIGKLETDPKDRVKALASCLHQKAPVVRVSVCKALAAMGSDAKEALPSLGKAKIDTNQQVRNAASAAIKAIDK